MRQGKSWRFLFSLVILGLLWAAPARAELGSFWRTQGDKPGPWMFNLKTGVAFGAYYYAYGGGPTQFSLQTEAGLAVDRARNAYLVLPLQFQFTPGLTSIIIPFGFQYDIQMPIKGLYIYPRFSAGFAALVYTGYYYYYRNVGGYADTDPAGVVIPEFGAKYVLKGRLNFGAELFSLPIFFGPGGAFLQYRVQVYAGINL